MPLLEEGGIEAFLRREVLPLRARRLVRPDSVKIGYEISFTRYFYKPQPLRSLEEIRADILALEKETEGLLGEILGEVGASDRRLKPYPAMRTRACRGWARCRSTGRSRALGAAASTKESNEPDLTCEHRAVRDDTGSHR